MNSAAESTPSRTQAYDPHGRHLPSRPPEDYAKEFSGLSPLEQALDALGTVAICHLYPVEDIKMGSNGEKVVRPDPCMLEVGDASGVTILARCLAIPNRAGDPDYLAPFASSEELSLAGYPESSHELMRVILQPKVWKVMLNLIGEEVEDLSPKALVGLSREFIGQTQHQYYQFFEDLRNKVTDQKLRVKFLESMYLADHGEDFGSKLMELLNLSSPEQLDRSLSLMLELQGKTTQLIELFGAPQLERALQERCTEILYTLVDAIQLGKLEECNKTFDLDDVEQAIADLSETVDLAIAAHKQGFRDDITLPKHKSEFQMHRATVVDKNGSPRDVIFYKRDQIGNTVALYEFPVRSGSPHTHPIINYRVGEPGLKLTGLKSDECVSIRLEQEPQPGDLSLDLGSITGGDKEEMIARVISYGNRTRSNRTGGNNPEQNHVRSLGAAVSSDNTIPHAA